MAHATSLSNHQSEVYATNASFVYSAKYTHAVLSLLDPQPGEKIIDLGCGTGDLTLKIKDAVGDQGEVVGVDSSESMVRRDSSVRSRELIAAVESRVCF
jgi:ubiquinone/menaquinone biosynthesis C-methylase UbiE